MQIRVTKKTLSNNDQNGLVIYAGLPFLVENYAPPNPLLNGNLYLNSFMCIYKAMT